jgi:Tfp pilus assembly protein PilE
MATETREQGSALIEVLVAFTILSLVVIAGYQVFSDAINRVNQARERQSELASAAQVLAAHSFDGPGRMQANTSDGRSFMIDAVALSPDLAPWAQSRPIRLRIWSGTEAGGPPLLETIVMSKAPPP